MTGKVPEWSIGAVSKTVVRFAYRGFESLPFRKMKKGFAIDLQVAFEAQSRKNHSLSSML